MWSFLAGVAVTIVVMANAAFVRRCIDRVILIGSGYAVIVGEKVFRGSMKVAEDFQDAVAEVRAERASSEQTGENIQSVLQALKREIEALRGELSKSKT